MTSLPAHPPLWPKRGERPVRARFNSYEAAGEGLCGWCLTSPRTLSFGPGGHKLCTNCIGELEEGPPPLRCVRCGAPEDQARLSSDQFGDFRCDECWPKRQRRAR